MGGLVPAIVQDAVTAKVLMLGFMNKEAYERRWLPDSSLSGAGQGSAFGPKARLQATSCIWSA